MIERFDFQKAIPVWEQGKSEEMNTMLLFEARFPAERAVTLRIAGHTGYRVFLNGEFLHFGPARAGHGFYRAEELDLPPQRGEAVLRVVSTGYYCRSFYWIREPSFFCAELICDGEVLAATGERGWEAFTVPSYLQKGIRYSYQRTFSEAYDLRAHPVEERQRVSVEPVGEKQFLGRALSLPDFPFEPYAACVNAGKAVHRLPKTYRTFRQNEPNPTCVDAFPSEQLQVNTMRLIEETALIPEGSAPTALPCRIEADAYVCFAMQGNRTGLIELDVEALADCDLFLTFDEILTEGAVDPFRMGCNNVLLYRLAKGERYHLLSAEPYTFGYINLITRAGALRIERLGIRRVGYDPRRIVKKLNTERADPAIARIHHAAVETFLQNTFDVYMDCPSRERAGWLCDSFFTSRVEYLLTGKSEVEHNFLSNFAMVERWDALPEGMLPMCYPADILKGEFIPNWAMWFVLELEEYFARTGDRLLVDRLRQKLYALLGYFRKFENERGLLERLEGWIFVEWSRCNQLVQDINYPTNMLYYRFKRVLAALYGDTALLREADALRATIRHESRTETFFCDNAVYDESGTAHLSGEISETCQYYAFYMGVASREEDAALWETLVNDFGPERKEKNKYPNVHFSNAFVGNYMRLDLLCEAELLSKLEENIRGYFDYMAKRTDTLWENTGEYASCNHGFASHVLVWLDRLGYLI